jgi:hypothetical protein
LRIASPRNKNDVIFVTSSLKEVFMDLENVVPIKGFDGKKSTNTTLTSLAIYLITVISEADDARSVIKRDFLSLSEFYEDGNDL